MSWSKDSDGEWIASNPITSHVRMDSDSLAPSLQEEARPPTPPIENCNGYRADTEPFDLFVKAGLIPIDRDHDVVWMQEGQYFRAYRISWVGPDDSVVPDLIVGGDPPMTIMEYLVALERYQIAAADHRAMAERVNVPHDEYPPSDEVFLEPQPIQKQSTTTPHKNHILRADPRLLQASVSKSAPLPPGQEPRFPLMPVRESDIIQYIHTPQKATLNTLHLGADTQSHQPTTSPLQESTPSATPIAQMTPPPAIPFAQPPPNNSQNHETTPSPPPLPSLPSRHERIKAIETFDAHPSATFARLTSRQRVQHDVVYDFEERKGRKVVGRV